MWLETSAVGLSGPASQQVGATSCGPGSSEALSSIADMSRGCTVRQQNKFLTFINLCPVLVDLSHRRRAENCQRPLVTYKKTPGCRFSYAKELRGFLKTCVFWKGGMVTEETGIFDLFLKGIHPILLQGIA